ncbi:hypothetical protein [Halofilum ochraceum]|uniref:hypothetical protein n=1 Tax=Halofilum ochraceum TaxID=1611323 RepID=UPI000829EF19|nr:hypothetical protein [Halofilum ochraceum]
MKAASATTTLGLILISGALLAATATPTGDLESRARAEFERLDRNADDRISRREAQANPGLATHFAKFDRDSDDTLVWDEFLRHEELSASGVRTTNN